MHAAGVWPADASSITPTEMRTARTVSVALAILGYVLGLLAAYLLYANTPPYLPFGAIAVAEEVHRQNIDDLRRRQNRSRQGFLLLLIATLNHGASRGTAKGRWELLSDGRGRFSANGASAP